MNDNIAFTICSNNYLPQACALKNSFLKFNEDFKFYIVLVDKLSTKIDYDYLKPAHLILASDIDLFDFYDLTSRYNIIELNTSIKPSVFKYLIKLNTKVNHIYYLDPDLFFYSSLHKANKTLEEGSSMVLTPHITSQIPRDNKLPNENIFLNFGIYNLGFIGLNANHNQVIDILDWWEERTLFYGYDNAKKGYFVDQLWMNLAPLFFNDVFILKHLGYNMAPWNLHERHLSKINKEYLINNQDTLVFYHFSKLSNNPNNISRVYNRFILPNLPLLNEMYLDYKKIIYKLNYENYKKIPIAFQLKNNAVNEQVNKPIFSIIKNKLKTLLKSHIW